MKLNVIDKQERPLLNNKHFKKGTLFYYFAFPHYRAAILEEIHKTAGERVSFVSGSSIRGNIIALTQEMFDPLRRVRSLKLGPFTWDAGVFKELWNAKYGTYVLGPSLSSLTSWMMLIVGKLTRKKIFLWGNCGSAGDRSPRRFIQEIMNRLAHGVLVYGLSEKEGATDLGLSKCKVSVVNNATRSNSAFLSENYSKVVFQNLQRNNESLLAGLPSFLTFVGRINAEKRIDILFEAMRKLQKIYPNLELNIVGDGPEKKSLERKFYDVKANFYGWIFEEDELEEIFHMSVASVSPFNIGLLAVDSLRYGVPVLVPDNRHNGSEIECLTFDVNAVAFRPGDSECLVSTFDDLIRMTSNISSDRFLAERERSLRVWDPSAVANNILSRVLE